jgi:hypothetical protein
MSAPCAICLSKGSEAVLVFDDGGAIVSHTCKACFDVLDGEDGCCVCGEATSGEYSLAREGHKPRDGGPLCSTCRRLLAFDNTPGLATRIVRLGLTRFTRRGQE